MTIILLLLEKLWVDIQLNNLLIVDFGNKKFMFEHIVLSLHVGYSFPVRENSV